MPFFPVAFFARIPWCVHWADAGSQCTQEEIQVVKSLYITWLRGHCSNQCRKLPILVAKLAEHQPQTLWVLIQILVGAMDSFHVDFFTSCLQFRLSFSYLTVWLLCCSPCPGECVTVRGVNNYWWNTDLHVLCWRVYSSVATDIGGTVQGCVTYNSRPF